MTQETIKVVVKKPGESPRVKDIEHTLEAMQGEVDGYIEQVLFQDENDQKYVMYGNEEGKIIGLDYNFPILEENEGKVEIVELVVGNVVIAKENGEDIESLSDENVEELFQLFQVKEKQINQLPQSAKVFLDRVKEN